MNPLWAEVNPLSQKSEPPPWRVYQNIRPNTIKDGVNDKFTPSFVYAWEEGTRKGGTSGHTGAKSVRWTNAQPVGESIHIFVAANAAPKFLPDIQKSQQALMGI